MDLRERDTMES